MAKSKASDPGTYTKPELRDRIKNKVVASDKGGNPGQWSARKAQLVSQEYEKEGGSYKKLRSAAQKSLKQWGDEHWNTSDGKRARRPGGTKRYLPEKAWDQLKPEEKSSTNRKKVEGSREGKQFVRNTKAAADARKSASKNTAADARKSASKKTAAKNATTKTKTAAKSAAPARKRTPAKRKTAAKKSR